MFASLSSYTTPLTALGDGGYHSECGRGTLRGVEVSVDSRKGLYRTGVMTGGNRVEDTGVSGPRDRSWEEGSQIKERADDSSRPRWSSVDKDYRK